ncbi:HAD family hydrolase [Gordonia liuliyuniae]|uniref:HAD-IB family hydrolase n=1 Tax=Gordonia liuliyuniae TaxID=2911517 RepID=A0ABS9IT54_9ACTN|nr:HAD family hydrolase [Gordonia liuliyuniae]MCF8588687.1 HAD-IB family hydrolase [Gordonia liuliyuniae]
MTTAEPTRIAAFFDLDKTVIARSSALAFTRPFYEGGLLSRRTMLRSGIAQLQFLLTAADENHVDKLRKHVTAMSTGWDAAQVRSIVAETLDDVVRPVVFPEALELIEQHKDAGHDVVLISASGIEMVEPIGELLGVDIVRASIMRVIDGLYAGDLDFYCYGDEKATVVEELAAERGYDLSQCYAYSDSATDLPMLDAVGRPAVVNPGRTLRRHAADNEWEILDFATPAAASHRPSPGTLGRGALCATGIGAIAAAAVIYHRHQARHLQLRAA